jgi:hypothetical protein
MALEHEEGELMIAEISVVPQRDGPARGLIGSVVSGIASRDPRYRVGTAGTTVEGAGPQNPPSGEPTGGGGFENP